LLIGLQGIKLSAVDLGELVSMKAGVLGPLVFVHAGKNLVPEAPKPRQLLAFLMLNANKMVRSSECITELWGADPPKSAMSTLQTYVLHIRRLLRQVPGAECGVLKTLSQGYELTLTLPQFDKFLFENLAFAGQTDLALGRVHEAAEMFSGSLSLWRGSALADVSVGPLSSAHIVELEETRRGILEQRIEADLNLGRHRMLLVFCAINS
jgi:SARP family transcriptional regulator, regulator of embCAB operon